MSACPSIPVAPLMATFKAGRRQVGADKLVPVGQQPAEPPSNQKRGGGAAEQPQRGPVFDSIGKGARIRTDRLEPVQMGPGGERPSLLLIHELPSFDHIAVARDPPQTQRALVYPQHRSGPVGDACARLDHVHPLPRRGQAFQCARLPMPGIGDLRRHL